MKLSDLTSGVVIWTPPRAATSKKAVGFASRYNPQGFHIDPARARGGGCKALIASGWHTCAIVMELMHGYFHLVYQWAAARTPNLAFCSSRRGADFGATVSNAGRAGSPCAASRCQSHLSNARVRNWLRATKQAAP
jgi:hypothetical protein